MSRFRLPRHPSGDCNGRVAAATLDTPPALAAWRGTARTSVVGGVPGAPPLTFAHGLAVASRVEAVLGERTICLTRGC